jgi:hypothetical protein
MNKADYLKKMRTASGVYRDIGRGRGRDFLHKVIGAVGQLMIGQDDETIMKSNGITAIVMDEVKESYTKLQKHPTN